MGLSLRKSFRFLPGIRINLSKSGPRLSVVFPAFGSIDIKGKARLYSGMAPALPEDLNSSRAPATGKLAGVPQTNIADDSGGPVHF